MEGTPIFNLHLLQGNSNEPANSIGSFGARLTGDHPVPSGEWTKVPFDEVLWDTAGMFDPRRSAFVARQDMHCLFLARGNIVIREAAGAFSFDFALYKNGAVSLLGEIEPTGPTYERDRSGPTSRGRNFMPGEAVHARPGDVFEIYVHQNAGTEVLLTGDSPFSPGEPSLAMPTANCFVGMYDAL